MCDIDISVDIEDIDIDTIQERIEIVNAVVNSTITIPEASGTLDRPKIILTGSSSNADKRLNQPEQQLITTIIENSGLVVDEALHNAANRVSGDPKEKLKIRHDDCTFNNVSTTACIAKTNTQGGTSVIKLNRDKIARKARDRYYGDTFEQEMIEVLKTTSESVIHELCHLRHPNETDLDENGNPLVGDQDYYEQTTMGLCQRTGFKQIFGEEPPGYRSVNPNLSPSYVLSYPNYPAMDDLGDIYLQEISHNSHLNHTFYVDEQIDTLGEHYDIEYKTP